MHVVIFEGTQWPTFAPVSLSRPVFSLASGFSSLLEKQIRFLSPTRLTLWVRPALAEYVRRRIVPKLKVPTTVNQPLDDEPALLLSGRTLHLKGFEHGEDECVGRDEGELVRHAMVRGRAGLGPDDVMNRTPRWTQVLQLPEAPAQTRMVYYLWDLVKWNEESLIQDFATMRMPSAPKPAGPYHLIEPDSVWLGEAVRLAPGVVLDASRGPVMLDSRSSIGAGSVIEGPCYIGQGAQVMPLTLIRPGTTIGTMCKVAGEVSNSVILGYTNKAHYGYLGDSYVGRWVNLGAGTTTSNLKNTYGQIKVTTGAGPVATGRRFLGAMIGDHAKTAIATRLMAGTYLGFSSMVACSAIAPSFVRSFAFLTDKGCAPYRLEKAIEVMKLVFGRRDRRWDDVDDAIVRYVEQAAGAVETAAG